MSDETGLPSLEEIMYFFGNRISFFAISISLFLYYAFRSAEYLYSVIIIIMKYMNKDCGSAFIYLIWGLMTFTLYPMVCFRQVKHLKGFAIILMVVNLILAILLINTWASSSKSNIPSD